MYYDHQNPSSDLVIPQVNASCKPVKGMIFESVDHAYDFYCEYAKKAGFCVHKGGSYMNDGLLKSKYFTCSKEGHKLANSYDSMAKKDGSNRPYYKRRKRPTIRCGCRAQICLKSDDGLRKLTHVQQNIIYEMSTLNLGHFKAFNIMRTKYGGFEEVGATKDDFFLDSFGIAPKVVVTDQDPAMKQEISLVLPNSRHRLCMWHIMKKFADKVCAALCNNEDFKRKICDIVWTDAISQSEFETQWKLIAKEYDLETNKWLCDIFEMRYDWIPSYYMDEPLSGLMHNGRKNNHDTRYTHPDPVSENPFEKEAVLMYTKAIFNDFQDKMYHIRSCVACLKSTEEEDFVRFSIFDFNAYVPGCLEVLFKKEGEEGIDLTISCGCKRFEHYGVTRFPKKYMVDRWKRDVGVNPRTAPISTFGNNKYLKVKEISREITLAGEYLINSYAADVDELTKVKDQMNIMIKQADETRYKRTHLSKMDRLDAILGYDQPSEVTIRVPSGIKNKGCWSNKRIKS
ncbi:protein FAR1-RELATED SEQUENCE 1-like [Bidens hawaiensis]|uniref:protein FAR1-RELATED SEQUENCE 1-like n=1 Tax=Bidens hawaiensis TaxID=980011 RepID=UPI0040491F23